MQGSQGRVEIVKKELENAKRDLRDTEELKAEAEAAGDPDFLREVAESEARFQGLVADLEAELVKLQKPSNNMEALRARLQAKRDREAQARSVLGSGDLSSSGPLVEPPIVGTAAPLLPTLPPVSNAPTTKLAASPSASSVASLPGSKNVSGRPTISDQGVGQFTGLGPVSASTPPHAFASSNVPLNKKGLDLATAPSGTSQLSHTSLANNPPKSASVHSLDSFGDNAFGGASSVKSAVKSSPSSPHQNYPYPPESAFTRKPDAPKPMLSDDFGFGDTAFPTTQTNQATPPTLKQWGGEQRPNLAEQGRGISLKDSFPQTGTQQPSSAGGASQWQAFDVPAANKPPTQPTPALGGFASSGFGANTFGAPTPKPALSAPSKSGNPFADGDDGADAPIQSSGFQPPAPAFSWAGSAGNTQRSMESTADFASGNNSARGPQSQGFPASQGFGSLSTIPSAPQTAQPYSGFQGGLASAASGSSNYDPFSQAPAPQQPQHHAPHTGFGSFDQDPFASSVPNSQPNTQRSQYGEPHHNGRFGHDGQPFLVTPSVVTAPVVIPDSDWDVFGSSQPAAAQPKLVDSAVNESVVDPNVWTPMAEADRTRVRAAYEQRYEAQNKGGVSTEEARELWDRLQDKPIPFENIFQVADIDGNGRLNFPEFLIYMHTLRLIITKKDLVKLPAFFSTSTASSVLGVDYSTLPALVNTSGTSDAFDEGGFPDFSAPQAPPAPPTSAFSSGPDQKLKTLMSKGSSEEDAKRALFLNGDDLEAAQDWLQTRKSTPADPGNIPGTLSAFPEQPESGAKTSVPEGPEGPRIRLKIDRAVVNYKKPLEKPVFSISIVNSWGDPVGDAVQTLPGDFDPKSGIIAFGHTVDMPVGIEKINDDSCIYFELKHYKAKEKKWSTLGWTYRHKLNFVKIVDSVKCVREEAQGLNLYEKPIDFRSHYRQASMKKMRPLSSSSPDLYLKVSAVP